MAPITISYIATTKMTISEKILGLDEGKEAITTSAVTDQGEGTAQPASPALPFGAVTVLVLASICLVLGIVYAYLYFTRINPRTTRSRKFAQEAKKLGLGLGDHEDFAGGPHHHQSSTQTHMFLFRKS